MELLPGVYGILPANFWSSFAHLVFFISTCMDALRRAKSERGGHRGIVTKTITELDILLANPADPNDLAATTKQLESLNVYKMKL